MIRRVALALMLLPLASCGLHPLYGGGSSGPVASGLAAIEVAPIDERAGWLVRNALVDRLGAADDHGGAARYRLDIRLDDRLEGLALLSDDTIGRERRTLRARYQLVDLSDGQIVLAASACSAMRMDCSISAMRTR